MEEGGNHPAQRVVIILFLDECRLSIDSRDYHLLYYLGRIDIHLVLFLYQPLFSLFSLTVHYSSPSN